MKATGHALLSVYIALITLPSNSFADSGLTQELDAFRKINGYEYDWRLNE